MLLATSSSSVMVQSHSTADPHGRSPRAKICVQIRVKRKNTFPGDQKRPRSSKGSGTSLPKKKARRKKRLQKSSRKLIQKSRGWEQVQGCRGVKARPPGAKYIDSPSGRGLDGPLLLSHWWIHKETSSLRCDWLVVWKGRSSSAGCPTWGLGLGGARTREAASARKASKNPPPPPHTHRPKKPEVSLLISRQPRYAGRARGFQRARLAWTFGEGCLDSPPSPRESPQPFPGSARGKAVQARGTSVCSPNLPRMATSCGWGGPAHLRRPQTLSNRTSRVNAIPALEGCTVF